MLSVMYGVMSNDANDIRLWQVTCSCHVTERCGTPASRH